MEVSIGACVVRNGMIRGASPRHFAGYSVFFVGAPLFLLLGSSRRQFNAWTFALGMMLWILAAKSLWLSSAFMVIVGTALLVGLSMTLSNFPPYLFELGIYAAQVFVAGYKGLMKYGRFLIGLSRWKLPNWINLALPLVTLITFSVLFILANPDLLKSFSEGLSRFVGEVRTWLIHFGPGPGEIVFRDPVERRAALDRFHQYAYQWY